VGARRSSVQYNIRSILENEQSGGHHNKVGEIRKLNIVDEDNATSQASSNNGESEKLNWRNAKNTPILQVVDNKNASDSTKNK